MIIHMSATVSAHTLIALIQPNANQKMYTLNHFTIAPNDIEMSEPVRLIAHKNTDLFDQEVFFDDYSEAVKLYCEWLQAVLESEHAAMNKLLGLPIDDRTTA